MKNLRDIIPQNIIRLRKLQGLTQLDLAKQINYSDKAVSRWEKGEVLPDIETLQNLSHVFNVPLSYLLEEHEDVVSESQNIETRNETVFQILLILAVWTIATIIFAYAEINFDAIYWQVFVWAVPASCLVVMNHSRKTKKLTISFIFRSIFCWSLLTSIYLQFLSYNAWLVFMIGIPIQAAIVVDYIAKKMKKLKKF